MFDELMDGSVAEVISDNELVISNTARVCTLRLCTLLLKKLTCDPAQSFFKVKKRDRIHNPCSGRLGQAKDNACGSSDF